MYMCRLHVKMLSVIIQQGVNFIKLFMGRSYMQIALSQGSSQSFNVALFLCNTKKLTGAGDEVRQAVYHHGVSPLYLNQSTFYCKKVLKYLPIVSRYITLYRAITNYFVPRNEVSTCSYIYRPHRLFCKSLSTFNKSIPQLVQTGKILLYAHFPCEHVVKSCQFTEDHSNCKKTNQRSYLSFLYQSELQDYHNKVKLGKQK